MMHLDGATVEELCVTLLDIAIDIHDGFEHFGSDSFEDLKELQDEFNEAALKLKEVTKGSEDFTQVQLSNEKNTEAFITSFIETMEEKGIDIFDEEE